MYFFNLIYLFLDELEKYLKEDKSEEIFNPSESNADLKKRAFSFLKDRIFLLLKCYKTTLEVS